MSSYIGVQVPDEPIGSGDDEGAHDQDYLQEYRFDQAPRPVTTRSRRGDASTLLALLGEPETEDESPVAASSAGPLPTVTFASPGVRTEQSQADTTSNQPRAATSLSQEYRGSPEQDRSKLGVERQPGDRSQSLPSVGTTAKTDDGTNSGDRAVNVEQQSTVTPSPQINIRPGPEQHISFKSPFTPNTANTALHPAAAAPPDRPRSRQGQSSLANVFQFNSQANGSGSRRASGASDEGRMFFGASKVPGTTAYRRKSLANTNAITNYEADLTSKDRAKQKEAVRRLLAERVRDDWEWQWPEPERDMRVFDTPGLEIQHEEERRPRLSLGLLRRSRDPSREPSRSISRAASPDLSDRPHRLSLSVLRRSRDPSREPSPDLGSDRPRRMSLGRLRMSRDPSPEPVELEWRQRDEWVSDYSDNETIPQASPSLEKTSSASHPSPFRFETPDGVGESVQRGEDEKRERRTKRSKEEMQLNDGLRCFVERRDAWTGARHVPKSPISPAMTRTRSDSSEDGHSSTAIDNDEDEIEEDTDTEVPIAPPLLPPNNAMRSSITPDNYNTIYDKVVLQQLSPSCPINLKDVVRSCVHGWKRDGEWPPTGTPMEPMRTKKKPRKLSVASIFGLDKGKDEKDKEPGSPIRRGLQRLMSRGKDGGSAVQSPTTPGRPVTPKDGAGA